MFWTDWGSSPKIEKANMDGTARQVLVSSRIVWINAISLDLKNKVLYWCDARLDKIEKVDFEGNNRKVVFQLYNPVGGGFFHQFGLAVHDDILYWTDWVRKSVIQYNTKSHRFDREWKGITRPMGLRVYDSQKLFKGNEKAQFFCLVTAIEGSLSCLYVTDREPFHPRAKQLFKPKWRM